MCTWGNIPDQQGVVRGESEAMSGAPVQDGVSGDLQRQFSLEALTGQTVGALRPPIAEETLSEEVRKEDRSSDWRWQYSSIDIKYV